MFNNISKKIKSLAQILCWAGIICSLVSGIVIIATGDLAFLGFVVIVIGSLLSWVSSFTLYGFGQLIENTSPLVQNVQNTSSNKKVESTKKIKEAIYTEEDFLKDIQNEAAKKQAPATFSTEVKETQTADLKLILQDQKDLYSEEELEIIKKELSARKETV